MPGSAAISPEASPRAHARAFSHRLHAGDQAAYIVTLICATSIILITSLVAFELFTNSATSRHRFGWGFLFTRTWDPVAGAFGALPFVYGTCVTSALALVLAVPLGVG